MNNLLNQRQEIENNLNQALHTIFLGYIVLDKLILKTELEESTKKQKELLNFYKNSKRQLDLTKQSIKKMQFYNSQNMYPHLERELLKSNSDLTNAINNLPLLDNTKKILLSSNESS